MANLLRLFVLAEALIRAVLVGVPKRSKARKTAREILAYLRARVVGTPDKPGAAWEAIAESYRKAATDAQKGAQRADRALSGVRHKKSAERLFRRLADRLDAAIAHTALDLDAQLGLKGVSREEIPEIKGFTDRAGRRWDLSVYARMCARTTAAEARSEATINSLLDRGLDLVRVSEHEHPADSCSRWEGRIFSISGGHPRYPKLRERPPFHPNCKHILREYRRGDRAISPASEREGRVRVDTDSLAAFLEDARLYISEVDGVVRIDSEGRVFLSPVRD